MDEGRIDKNEEAHRGGSDVDRQNAFTVKHAIDKYLSDINALEFAYPLAIDALNASFKSYTKGFAKSLVAEADPAELREFIRRLSIVTGKGQHRTKAATVSASEDKLGEEGVVSKASEDKSFSISIASPSRRIEDSIENLAKVNSAKDLISRSFIVTLVSQFDTFIASLVRALYEIRPDILNLHAKTILYSELKELGTVRAVEEQLIEVEIESLLRTSHSEQFKWLETKFGLPLRESEVNWTAFVELTERRNLFVHSNGRVSSQYLRVCGNNKVQLDKDCRLGAKLAASGEYFAKAHALLIEIGLKLGVILWRKVAPTEQHIADALVISVTYNLIKAGKFSLAESILKGFLFTIPRGERSDATNRAMIVNLAQCLKWQGQDQNCRDLLGRFDWSATSALFNSAIAVLRDDFPQAKKHLQMALRDESLKNGDLETWPLFREFRKSSEYEDLRTEMMQGAARKEVRSVS